MRRTFTIISICLFIIFGVAVIANPIDGNLPRLAFIALLIQWCVYLPSYMKKTEHYYDLTGSATYLILIIGTWLSLESGYHRSELLAMMVTLWALRLGSFLFHRVKIRREDDRFRNIKDNPQRFFCAWTIQGLWVFITASPALTAMTNENNSPIGIIGVLGVALWSIGFLIEMIADQQKTEFNQQPKNTGKFINTGLWKRVRHPNYSGEIMLWIGVFLLSCETFSIAQWVTVLSPITVIILLTKVSGIPMLTEKARKKWGGQPDWEAYIKETPALVPKFTKK